MHPYKLEESIVVVTTELKDNKGQSPYDITLANFHKEGCSDVALHLTNLGYGDDKGKTEMLDKACQWGKLDVVGELVEKHKLDPRGICT